MKITQRISHAWWGRRQMSHADLVAENNSREAEVIELRRRVVELEGFRAGLVRTQAAFIAGEDTRRENEAKQVTA